MRLYPAIDLIEGACVRLSQGDYQKKTTFAEDPIAVAKRWQNEGGEFLHLVDLDGAKSGTMPNFDLICKIAASLEIPVEVGGGIRDDEAVERYLEHGVQRVILGTAAISDHEFVSRVVERYRERIVVGIDAKDGMVAINGWKEVSKVSALSLAEQMQKIGVQTVIYTDISTDGMLQGPNLDAMKEMVHHVTMDVVASGGVTKLSDITNLAQCGVEGAIIGKALYTYNIDFTEAVALCRTINERK